MQDADEPVARRPALQGRAASGWTTYARVTVPHAGFSINALLHASRTRRTTAEAAAITARVTPTLHALGAGHFTDAATLRVPLRRKHGRQPPAAAVTRLARNLDAALIVTPTPLRGPLAGLTPTTPTNVDTAQNEPPWDW